MSENVQEAWPAATGITDLPEGVDLSVAEMRRIEAEWASQREEAAGRPELAQFTRELSREWAIETGQIENLYEIERGVTLTLIAQGFDAALLPHGASDKDPEYVLNLLRDQQSALEFLFDVVGTNRELSEGFAKELHALMMAHQPTTEAMTPDGQVVEVELRRGEYKTHPNYPRRNGTVYTYCPPEQVSSEMGRLIAMHRKHEARGVAPEVSAAWLHHRFTQIHPFQDGNGRIARALASLVLIRANLFPLVVPVDQKTGYLDALERADAGDLKPLVFVAARRQQAAFRRVTDLLTRIVART